MRRRFCCIDLETSGVTKDWKTLYYKAFYTIMFNIYLSFCCRLKTFPSNFSIKNWSFLLWDFLQSTLNFYIQYFIIHYLKQYL